jgi:hypothetical protein
MDCRGFHFKSIGVNTHAHKKEPPPNSRISNTNMRLFMNTVQIQLKSWDSRIPSFQLDLKLFMNSNSGGLKPVKYYIFFITDSIIESKSNTQS